LSHEVTYPFFRKGTALNTRYAEAVYEELLHNNESRLRKRMTVPFSQLVYLQKHLEAACDMFNFIINFMIL